MKLEIELKDWLDTFFGKHRDLPHVEDRPYILSQLVASGSPLIHIELLNGTTKARIWPAKAWSESIEREAKEKERAEIQRQKYYKRDECFDHVKAIATKLAGKSGDSWQINMRLAFSLFELGLSENFDVPKMTFDVAVIELVKLQINATN